MATATQKTSKPRKKANLPPPKTLIILPSKDHPTLVRIAYQEGGNVPKELDGNFNSKKNAKKIISEYLELKKLNSTYLDHVRDKENAEEKDEARV